MATVGWLLLLIIVFFLLLPPAALLLVVAAGRRATASRVSAHFAWPSSSAAMDARRRGRKRYASWSKAAPEQREQELRVKLYRSSSSSSSSSSPAPVEEKVECVVCLSGVEEGDETRELACRHVFHRACLDAWLARPPATCPLCRARLSSAATPESDSDWEEEADSDLVLLMAYVQGTGGGRGSWFWSP
ncbi:E3 ubiquitin-protein ligase Os03g0188200 [Brachypodium distachyon]|uniref:RING-type domain-containing protein n=1 Tax=Brachypodium distachyon TaxID=15368 RepID=I1GR05_BRADI|nr:E3 ubiquitin-protein ligase Os03g0188200 [Brachypodium distachyon]KQK14565.1 hypothetical protein BRADI_1g17310v3 [Brachypodium distachyon]|eukprot:XP_003559771.1 E3 ubiquitin-protein ligase Os03g0188200 [Brachypodium distachyon]